MLSDPRYLIGAALVGLGATLVIDAWALVLRRGFDIPSLNYCLLGWASLLRPVLFHS